MSLKTVAAIAAMGVALSGFATIVKGTTQSVAFDSAPIEGANCSLAGEYGTLSLTTPQTISVKRGGHDMTAVCKKDGYQDATQSVPAHFNSMTVGNVLLGGIIGVGVDAATGANYSYPDKVMITMMPVGPAAPTSVAPAAPAQHTTQAAPADSKAATKSTS